MLARIQAEGFKHYLLENATLGDANDVKSTLSLAKEIDCEWVFLDGYHFDFTYQKQIHAAALKVAIMEDYDQCDQWCADLIVNQNLAAEGKTHPNTLPGGQSLSGACFALLRKEFLKISNQDRKPQWPPQRILVTMGGVDPDDATGLMLRSLNMITDKDFKVKVIVGGANPHQKRLEQFTLQSKHQVEILNDITDMPALYQWADAAITAGGSTCYEWMRYGLPACVVTIADNQESIVDALAKQKNALTLGQIGTLTLDATAEKLRTWFAGDLPRASEQIVDAQGARRVAAHLDKQLSISIASAEGSWINPLIISFAQALKAKGHSVRCFYNASEAPPRTFFSYFHTGTLYRRKCARHMPTRLSCMLVIFPKAAVGLRSLGKFWKAQTRFPFACWKP